MAKKNGSKRDEIRQQVDKEVVEAVEYALDEAVAVSGGVLTGFSMKIGEMDVLLTLRARVDGIPSVSFVGCPDMPSCLRKAVVEGFHGELRWKDDEYAIK